MFSDYETSKVRLEGKAWLREHPFCGDTFKRVGAAL